MKSGYSERGGPCVVSVLQSYITSVLERLDTGREAGFGTVEEVRIYLSRRANLGMKEITL
jgi:hypothetical protein